MKKYIIILLLFPALLFSKKFDIEKYFYGVGTGTKTKTVLKKLDKKGVKYQINKHKDYVLTDSITIFDVKMQLILSSYKGEISGLSIYFDNDSLTIAKLRYKLLEECKCFDKSRPRNYEEVVFENYYFDNCCFTLSYSTEGEFKDDYSLLYFDKKYLCNSNCD